MILQLAEKMEKHTELFTGAKRRGEEEQGKEEG